MKNPFPDSEERDEENRQAWSIACEVVVDWLIMAALLAVLGISVWMVWRNL